MLALFFNFLLKCYFFTQEKERESCRSAQMGPWGMLLMHLPQISLAERSYTDLSFLRTKNKGFLRKDVRNFMRGVMKLKYDLYFSFDNDKTDFI